ncbi:hypothetical protein K402DRAFT_123488 [Aulographum hederae CBS 113979]|uniref:Uncharacterized protein n=1 Tax=Aulographum hederae CBS 113979 TaxID=1176131 RepID=A0A6G1HE46_9PEZI|nr:hypothetical protein K402DRAFT_123488 [Aulographum hederae CBS 113979]
MGLYRVITRPGQYRDSRSVTGLCRRHLHNNTKPVTARYRVLEFGGDCSTSNMWCQHCLRNCAQRKVGYGDVAGFSCHETFPSSRSMVRPFPRFTSSCKGSSQTGAFEVRWTSALRSRRCCYAATASRFQTVSTLRWKKRTVFSGRRAGGLDNVSIVVCLS